MQVNLSFQMPEQRVAQSPLNSGGSPGLSIGDNPFDDTGLVTRLAAGDFQKARPE